MKCKEITHRLLDLLEGNLPDGEARRVREHLEECPRCRQEAECMKAGMEGVRDAVPLQVGSGPHLTPCRKEATLGAAREARKTKRLFTVRKVAAAAAVAMLLVSAWFLAQDFMPSGRLTEQEQTPTTAQEGPRRQPAPGIRAGDFPVEPGAYRVSGRPAGEGWSSRPPRRLPAPEPKELMFNQPGNLEVPVQNVHYDSRRERNWW